MIQQNPTASRQAMIHASSPLPRLIPTEKLYLSTPRHLAQHRSSKRRTAAQCYTLSHHLVESTRTSIDQCIRIYPLPFKMTGHLKTAHRHSRHSRYRRSFLSGLDGLQDSDSIGRVDWQVLAVLKFQPVAINIQIAIDQRIPMNYRGRLGFGRFPERRRFSITQTRTAGFQISVVHQKTLGQRV